MIKLDVTYSDYVNTSDPKYPAGKAVDASGEENTDGTPLLAKWMNDINGTRQAIIKEAFGDMSGVSGVPDDVENSDVLKAIKKITQEYTNSKIEDEAQARAQGDTDALSSAKGYADGKIGAEAQARIQGDVDTLSSANGYVNSKISAEAQARVQGDSSTLNAAKSYINQKFIKHYEKGYLQMPGMPSPLEDTSMHYSGYSWYEINYDGNFFRAKGRSAKAFSTKKLTKQQIKNGIYAFRGDEQGDAIRNITGSLGQEGNSHSVCFWDTTTITNGVGALRGGRYANWLRSNSGNYSIHFYGLTFDAARVVPTAEENRSRNLTFTFWVLIKNE